jgi:hypothetical protein
LRGERLFIRAKREYFLVLPKRRDFSDFVEYSSDFVEYSSDFVECSSDFVECSSDFVEYSYSRSESDSFFRLWLEDSYFFPENGNANNHPLFLQSNSVDVVPNLLSQVNSLSGIFTRSLANARFARSLVRSLDLDPRKPLCPPRILRRRRRSLRRIRRSPRRPPHRGL